MDSRLNIAVDCAFICEPVYQHNGKLLAVELLSRFTTTSFKSPIYTERFLHQLNAQTKAKLLHAQLCEVKNQQKWFIEHQIILSINIDFDMTNAVLNDDDVISLLDSMPFIRLEIMESFPNLGGGAENALLSKLAKRYSLWLDDFGSGNAHLAAAGSGFFECVKIDKHFYWQWAGSVTFDNLVTRLREHCQNVVVEGVETHLQYCQLADMGVDAMQGYLFSSCPLEEVSHLPLQYDRFNIR
ncbi:TPA: EAL domain-containing protein [Yersinia enterocolitica]|uniref:EAL domain-containing protein n=1 Tax=Yersinia enterocolitica TaxID=630 RepID=UPI00155AE4DD|nr:EAL domain-containing protein [Yersinia enterocolitica]EKN3726560.1 EAL domain-containing protein [Yersinia enterocolitica]EKN4810390.1 EAL domain-containing protein [Yersinia enterocolitica]EKN6373005.1 EAL domain-containing protein [Yersinia enterocolitica]ELI8293341.1 EAL domain-containing protein [Yersinia enterocolitica]EMA9253422.1 EAL domain-containing protein [Yersinia enterocolitica]